MGAVGSKGADTVGDGLVPWRFPSANSQRAARYSGKGSSGSISGAPAVLYGPGGRGIPVARISASS